MPSLTWTRNCLSSTRREPLWATHRRWTGDFAAGPISGVITVAQPITYPVVTVRAEG